ncbi:MAG: efflux RND transporter permease subunit [Acidobacteriota bacterium]|jgi:HAE1 family hydrophobic/amphiphilic exporter-1
MRIVELSLKRRVTVAMAALAVSLFGVVAFSRLPIDLLPDISYPSLTVETRFPGAAPAEVESLLTRPVEEAVGVVGGVQRISSVSRPGLSQVTLEFDWDRDMDFAALDVRQKLELVALPERTGDPVLLRFDPENDPIMRLYVTPDGDAEGAPDLFRLRYLGEEVLEKDLESTEGLAAVKVSGGYEEEIQVRIDEGKLSLLGLDIDQVRDRLARENVNQAGGSLYEEEARYLVRSKNEFESLDDILATTVLADGERLVTLADVATVERTHRRREIITRFGGREAVELALYKEGDANTVAVAKAVRQRLERIREELPEGIAVVPGVDQSRFIEASIREVLGNAALGGGIAVLVLLLFLRNVRSTLVIGVSIPLSIVATFFLMYRTGTSLNIMSLGGLALGVGMLVDNAIVVLEAIHRRLEEGYGAFEAARKGASEVGRAVAASTLTTVAVFLPVVFLEGIAAQLFRDQALTVSFSLIASLAVSLTLIPMLVAVLASKREGGPDPDEAPAEEAAGTGIEPEARFPRLRRVRRVALVTIPAFLVKLVRILFGWLGRALAFVTRPVGKLFDRGMGALNTVYPKVLGRALDSPGFVLALAFMILVAAVALVPILGLDLIPTVSQGEFGLRVELPEGTPLPVTDRFVGDLQDALADDPRVESFSSIAGGAGLALSQSGSGGGTEGENVARLQVRLAPGNEPGTEEAVMESLRERLEGVEGVRYQVERPAVFTLRTPVEVEVYGDDLDQLHAAAADLESRLVRVPGLVDLESSAELGNPELQVTFDREQLVKLGLDLGEVAATVRNKIQGDVATRLTEGDREIDIVVRSTEAGAASVEDVAGLIVGQRAASDAGARSSGSSPSIPIRLDAVADVHLAEGPAEIRRIGQKRAAVIGGDLAGRDMGAVAEDIRGVLREATLPLGVTAALGGQQEEMARSMRSLLLAMGLAVFLVYLVMASQFESFLHPFVIVFTLPLGAIGVIAALALTGTTLNVVALIGAVMLAGIVVNNAIVLVDAVNRLRREDGLGKRAALIEAGRLRMRPILMTSATTIFGLLPMALGLGEGAELRAPLAITVIGGLTVATVLTLVVIPVVYSVLDRTGEPVREETLESGPGARGGAPRLREGGTVPEVAS